MAYEYYLMFSAHTSRSKVFFFFQVLATFDCRPMPDTQGFRGKEKNYWYCWTSWQINWLVQHLFSQILLYTS